MIHVQTSCRYHKKLVLAELNVNGSIKPLYDVILDAYGEVLGHVPRKHLHAAMFALIIEATKSQYVWNAEGLETLHGMFGPHFRIPRASEEDAVLPPEFYRPEGTRDEITDELNARLRRTMPAGELVDIPFAPVGASIDPRSLCQPFGNAPTSEICTVCQESLGGLAQEVVQLKTCHQFIHLDCLQALVDQIYLGRPAVRCPICRGELCAARDYRAVLEQWV